MKFVVHLRLHVLWMTVGTRRPSKFYRRNIPGRDEGPTGSKRRIQQEGHTEDPKNVQVQQTQTKQLLIAGNLIDQNLKVSYGLSLERSKENRESSPLQLNYIALLLNDVQFWFDQDL